MANTTVDIRPVNIENYIVGIGASAGGLEALQAFFAALPLDTGVPYIVIQHLSADYKSLLSEILSKSTKLPVTQVENGMEVLPNHVYVIAPGQTMKISNRRIRLTPQDKSILTLPIDIFFRSLAEEVEGGAVAVILSGTGSDGSSGIKDIKERGGVIFVQDPETCKFDGMPVSALQTGLADASLAPEAIAREIVQITELVKDKLAPIESEDEINAAALEKIYENLKKTRNIDFRQYRKETVLRRTERRMILLHKTTLAEYADYLAANPEESVALSKDLLIGVTRFFRDTDCFEKLREEVIRPLLKNAEEQIRVWVAGCSTGEEAYSIAILFKEEMESLGIKREVKIFATDLDETSIAVAAAGVYGDNILESVSVSRLSRFFTRRDKEYSVGREIRQMVVFSPHNVFSNPPFARLDLISCRNMLIYFQPELQNQLFATFHAALKSTGYLFLGKSESLGDYTKAFPVLDSKARLFTHNSEVKVSKNVKIPFMPDPVVTAVPSKAQQASEETAPAAEDADADCVALNAQLFERFMPASVVVNEANEVIHFLGEHSNYLCQLRGKTSLNLFDLLTEGLRITVSTLLKEARESAREVQYKGVSFHGENHDETVTITAAPLKKPRAERDELYAVIFSGTQQRGETEGAAEFDFDRVSAQRITDLEQELTLVQLQLVRNIAEKESANEELQAANEEMLTSNEELQSSNEELQSVNQELYTVNAEYQLKLAEVSRLSDDITNFLASTMVGVIFVDENLHISRFTQHVATEFSVMEQDIGRPLDCIAYNFVSDDIEAICRDVIKNLTPIEREIKSKKDKVFFTRVAPYGSADNRAAGCVITLMDITSLKEGQRDLAKAVKDLSASREAAEEASHAKSDFLSRMSHDIRTPLNAIIGSVKLAMEERNPPETDELLNSINVASKYLLGLINDILDLSKIESGKIELHEEPYTRGEFLLSINTVIRPLMDFKGIDFEINYDGEGEGVIVDKLRFNQIFFNLLSNAAKFTPPGGRVEFVMQRILDHDGRYGMRYYVRDTGAGMSEQFQKVCFDSFSQENAIRNSETVGSGLGLAIVKHLVDAMHGTISVKSDLGKGTEFILEFYMNTTDRRPESPISVDVDYSHLNGCRILLADDNEMNLSITKKILERNGCLVDTAKDGEQALGAFVSSQLNYYDIILTDVRMPVMDGLEEARRIRALDRPDAQSIPIVALTADAFDEERDKTIAAGMTARLVKPVEPELLYATIAGLIGK